MSVDPNERMKKIAAITVPSIVLLIISALLFVCLHCRYFKERHRQHSLRCHGMTNGRGLGEIHVNDSKPNHGSDVPAATASDEEKTLFKRDDQINIAKKNEEMSKQNENPLEQLEEAPAATALDEEKRLSKRVEQITKQNEKISKQNEEISEQNEQLLSATTELKTEVKKLKDTERYASGGGSRESEDDDR